MNTLLSNSYFQRVLGSLAAGVTTWAAGGTWRTGLATTLGLLSYGVVHNGIDQATGAPDAGQVKPGTGA